MSMVQASKAQMSTGDDQPDVDQRQPLGAQTPRAASIQLYSGVFIRAERGAPMQQRLHRDGELARRTYFSRVRLRGGLEIGRVPRVVGIERACLP